MVAERAEFVARKAAKFIDNAKMRFGDLADAEDPAQSDASIYWDGTRFVIDTVLGILHFGHAEQTVGSQLHIFDGGTNKPGILVLYQQDGSASVFWSDAGVLRHHTDVPTTAASDGTIVGEDGS